MKALVINDILPYIPYGLKVKSRKYPDEIFTVRGYNIDKKLEVESDKYFAALPVDDVIPILYPMEFVTKPITVNGKKFVLADEMRKPVAERGGTAEFTNTELTAPMNHYGERIPYTFMEEVLTWFYKYKFDYKGLIAKGNAESTVVTNPYEYETKY